MPSQPTTQEEKNMAKTAAKFTQADAARAIRAIKQAGGGMRVVIERDGRMILEPTAQEVTQDEATDEPNGSLDNARRPRL